MFLQFVEEKYKNCDKRVEGIIYLDSDTPYLKLNPETHSVGDWEVTEVIPSKVLRNIVLMLKKAYTIFIIFIQIPKDNIKCFKPKRSFVVPSCHFNFCWKSKSPVNRLNLKINFEGVVDEDFFCVILPAQGKDILMHMKITHY